MLQVQKLSPYHSSTCYSFFDINSGDLDYFISLGWKHEQFNKQLLKEINYGLGLFYGNKLEGFVLGDIITVEKKIEYEILLLYVTVKKRELGYANKLLKTIPLIFNIKHLKKIYLEVSADNLPAINLYKKNIYIQTGIRKNYYLLKNKKINAYYFEKIINE